MMSVGLARVAARVYPPGLQPFAGRGLSIARVLQRLADVGLTARLLLLLLLRIVRRRRQQTMVATRKLVLLLLLPLLVRVVLLLALALSVLRRWLEALRTEVVGRLLPAAPR